MQRRFLFLLITLLLVPIAAAARVSDGEFRSCMRSAMQFRDERTLDVARRYHFEWQVLLDEQRRRNAEAWDIEHDRDRDRIIRDIDRDIRNRLRDNDNIYRNDLKNIRNDFRNDERNCRNALEQRYRDVPTGLLCFSSDDCRPPLGICGTERGECRPACQPGSHPCIQVCAGKCRLR